MEEDRDETPCARDVPGRSSLSRLNTGGPGCGTVQPFPAGYKLIRSQAREDESNRGSCFFYVQSALFRRRFPPPTARTDVFTGLDRSGARSAPNTWISAVVQRVIRNVVRFDVSPHFVVCPIHEGIEFGQTVLLIQTLQFQNLPRNRLLAPKAGNPA